jgi:hypothetical protein
MQPRHLLLDDAFSATLKKAGQDFISGGGVNKLVDPISGLEITFHKTGWTYANGIWGYLHAPGVTTVQTARAASREQASKHNQEVVIHP